MSIEPSTSAKCIVKTSKGRIDIELWARELPKTTKSFLESCQGQKLEKLDTLRSDGTVTMVGGAPNKELEIERHARIRSCRRGSVGYDKSTNQWFLSSEECSVYDNDRWTLIGKIVGESNYLLRRIVDESELDGNGRFVYPPVVNYTEVTVPFFDLNSSLYVPESKPANSNLTTSCKRGNPKVKLAYDYEEDEEEDAIPLKKNKLPLGVRDKGDHGPPAETQALKVEEPIEEKEELSARERTTLDLLFRFQQRQKINGNPLVRPQPKR